VTMKQFVVQIAERMLKILELNKSGDSIIADTVFPSFEDISHCVTNHLVSPKDHLIYKLLLDYYEKQLGPKPISAIQLKFYKTLTKKQYLHVVNGLPPLQQKIETNAFKFIKRSSNQHITDDKVTFEDVFATKIGSHGEKIDI